MNSRKKKKRIRNAVCITICLLLLLVTLFITPLLTGALGKFIKVPEPINNAIDKLKQTETQNPNKNDTETPSEADSSLFTVCIDAGHGGKDIGSDSDGRIEKDDNLKLSLAVEAYLKEKNVKVVMTRSDDTFLKLSARCKVANDANADYFVSLHRNKGEGFGVETWILSQADEETKTLADNIMSGLETAGIQRNRGVKQGTQGNSSKDYYINLNSQMPSCIIELGFLNVPEDNQLYDEHLADYAKAIGDAIIKTAEAYNVSGVKTDGSDKNNIPDANTEDASGLPSTSHTLNNTQIDISSLDTTILDWGQGSNVDDQNRPGGCLQYQEKYGKYNAHFISEGEKIIYLTFDEGYEYGCTPSILDTLKEKNVKAVFFVTQPYAKEDPDLVQRIIDEGHMLGNHSVTHPATGLPSQTVEQQQSEIMDNHNYIKENFGGYEMHLFRYPAGKFSEQSLAILNNCNYKSVFWSFAYLDYDVNNQPNEAESLQKLIDRLHSGAIYLLHAESKTNTAILGDFIDQARALGFEFALFD